MLQRLKSADREKDQVEAWMQSDAVKLEVATPHRKNNLRPACF